MKISELIIHLQELKDKYGDIVCVTSGPNEYCGSIENEIIKENICFSEHAQPAGPKSGKHEKGLVFNNY